LSRYEPVSGRIGNDTKGGVVGKNNSDVDGRDGARNQGVDGRIILKWILRRLWAGLIRPRIGARKTVVFIKG
jgi:hypothetical protein